MFSITIDITYYVTGYILYNIYGITRYGTRKHTEYVYAQIPSMVASYIGQDTLSAESATINRCT